MCQIISTLRLGENSRPLTISTAEAEEEEIYKVEFFAAVIAIEERQRHCCRRLRLCSPAPTALFYRRGGRGRRDALTLFFRRGYFASRRESRGERGEGGRALLGRQKFAAPKVLYL